jgi:DNA-3-methyladenine glycosylase I
MKTRCAWVPEDPLYRKYHDREWGTPLHNDRKLFELMALEGMQAGLSWSTVLKKREDFRRAFDNFDPLKVAAYGEEKILTLLQDEGIIRNRRKIESIINNARLFSGVAEEFGSFDSYIWSFVGGKPIVNHWKSIQDIPAETEESKKMSRSLSLRGFSFVGPTICYAYMQSAGLVNDHTVDCFRYREILNSGSSRSSA